MRIYAAYVFVNLNLPKFNFSGRSAVSFGELSFRRLVWCFSQVFALPHDHLVDHSRLLARGGPGLSSARRCDQTSGPLSR